MVWVVISSVIGGLLVIAGAPKLRDRAGMLRVVQGYRLLPPVAERPVALALPSIEIAVGALLLTGIAAGPAALASTAIFLVFSSALSINLLRGRRDLDCGCFSFAGRDQAPRIGWWHAGRALALTAASGVLAVAPAALGSDPVGLAEHLAGTALAGLVLAAAFAVGALRSIVQLGHRPVDEHLARAAYELRTAAPAR